jgi:hypothetical protein
MLSLLPVLSAIAILIMPPPLEDYASRKPA